MALAQQRGTRRGLSSAVKQAERAMFRERLATLGLGLENRLTDRIGLLSGGQRQAVSLLMAALQPSRILLLDEHTAALDPATAEKVLAITIQIVKEQSLPTMMITHNMTSALALGTRTIMMEQGRIMLDIAGEERAHMKVEDLLRMYSGKRGKQLDNDRMLLSE